MPPMATVEHWSLSSDFIRLDACLPILMIAWPPPSYMDHSIYADSPYGLFEVGMAGLGWYKQLFIS